MRSKMERLFEMGLGHAQAYPDSGSLRSLRLSVFAHVSFEEGAWETSEEFAELVSEEQLPPSSRVDFDILRARMAAQNSR